MEYGYGSHVLFAIESHGVWMTKYPYEFWTLSRAE